MILIVWLRTAGPCIRSAQVHSRVGSGRAVRDIASHSLDESSVPTETPSGQSGTRIGAIIRPVESGIDQEEPFPHRDAIGNRPACRRGIPHVIYAASVRDNCCPRHVSQWSCAATATVAAGTDGCRRCARPENATPGTGIRPVHGRGDTLLRRGAVVRFTTAAGTAPVYRTRRISPRAATNAETLNVIESLCNDSPQGSVPAHSGGGGNGRAHSAAHGDEHCTCAALHDANVQLPSAPPPAAPLRFRALANGRPSMSSMRRAQASTSRRVAPRES
jgi:hypothetical protein